MTSRPTRCVLVLRDGARHRVGPGGIVIGRQADCDIMSFEPTMSRRHALVRITARGPDIVPLGRGAVTINGVQRDQPHPLAHGDDVTLPGLVLRVELQEDETASDGSARFIVERRGADAFGIRKSPFLIGGSASDDFILPGWPPAALVLHLEDIQLYVEPRIEGVLRNEVPLSAGTRHPLTAGDVLRLGDETFRIRTSSSTAETTVSSEQLELPLAVELETLPRGGLVVFTTATGKRSVFLADRRFDLLVALLQPREGHAPGDFIGDDIICSAVWPRSDGAGRTELNTLILRCRRDLVEAGLPGAQLLQRAPRGGGTRFVVAPGATIGFKA